MVSCALIVVHVHHHALDPLCSAHETIRPLVVYLRTFFHLSLQRWFCFYYLLSKIVMRPSMCVGLEERGNGACGLCVIVKKILEGQEVEFK